MNNYIFFSIIGGGFMIAIMIFIGFRNPSEINLKDYNLVWEDKFSGRELDKNKWSYRVLGKRKKGFSVKENVYLNGFGKLVIKIDKIDDKYTIGQIGTHKTFSTKYGYFECRAKMHKRLGAHAAFWLQSATIDQVGNPKKNGAEIDIFEYHNKTKDVVHQTIHWDGYKEHHKYKHHKTKIPKISKGYHTFGLEWTPEEYVFYVDGKETWRTKEAVSNIPQYMILSTELSGWGGDITKEKLPDKVLFDYVRVYKRKQ